MMSNRVFVIFTVMLLGFLAVSEAMSLRSLAVEQHCRCIVTESQNIRRLIGKVELISPNSHCEETEIIGTLKSTGQEVCLDPEAHWVKKMIRWLLSNRRR